ncbi:defective chorion-1 protein, FC125 isoform isoform X2 [Bactrocera tryoni]|uniref:defective chorion-1 protein, FC125 isoform isoform X2 n=1 Tax=Bactrocera tryoni TaxID=59916 RepID=UPI001A963E08|nr:defective chorion-1 protein, FC125 isoform isoform X2 [Bactrocera tryoni]
MFWCKHFAVLAFLLALSVSSNASSQDKSTTAAAETTRDEDTIDLTPPADLTTEKDEDERGADQIVGQSLFPPILGQSILPTPFNLFSAMFPALNSLLLMGNLFPATSLLGAPSLLGSTHQLGAAASDEMPADSKVVLVLAEDRNPNAAMRAAHQEAARTIRQNDMFSQFLAQFGQADFGQMLAQSLEQMQQQNPNQLLQQNAGQLLQQFVPQDFSQTMGQLLSQTFQQFPGLDMSQLPMLGQAPPSTDPSVGSALPEAEGEAAASAGGAAPQAPTGFQIPNFQSAFDAGTQLLGQALQQPNSDSSSGFQLPNFQSALDAGTQMLGQAFQQANADVASGGFQLPNFQSVIDTSNQMLSQGGSLFNLRPLQSLDPSTSASDAEPAASQISEVRVKPDTISIADHDQKRQKDVNMDELKMTSALQKALLYKKLPILWFRIPADSSEKVHDLGMKEPNASKVKNVEEKQLQTKLKAFQRQVMTELKLLQDIERQAKEMRAASLGSKSQNFKDDANANTHTSMLSKIPIHKITRSDIEKALNDDYVKKLLHKAAIANRKEVGKMPIYTPSGINIKRQTSKSMMAPRQMSRDDIVRLMAYAYRMASDNGIRMLESSESKKPSGDPELDGNQASGDTSKTTERKWPSDAKTPMNRQWLNEENRNSDAKAFKQDPQLMQMRQMWAEPKPQVAIQQPMMMQQMPMMQQHEMPQMVAKQAPMELQHMPMSMMQQQQMPQMVAQQAPKEMQHIPMPIMQQPHMSAPQAPMEMRQMSRTMQEPRMVAQQTPMEQIQEPQMLAQQAPMQIQQMPMPIMQQQQMPQMVAQQLPMEIQQMPMPMMQQLQMPQMVAQQVPMEIQQMPMPMMQQQQMPQMLAQQAPNEMQHIPMPMMQQPHMEAQQAPMEMRQMSRTMQEPRTVAQQIPMMMQNPRVAMQQLPMLMQHTPMISQQPQTEVMPQMGTQDGTMMLQQMSPDMQRHTEEQNVVGEATPQMSENAGKARFKGGSAFDEFDMLGLGGGHDKGKKQKHGSHSGLRPTIINYYYNAGGRPSTYNTGGYGGGSSGYGSSSKPSYGASYGSGGSEGYGTPNAYAGNAPSYGSYGASAGGSYSSGSYRTAVGDDEIRAMLQEHSQMKMMSDIDRNPVNTTVVPSTTTYQETSSATENINQKQPTSQTETSSITDKPKSTTTTTITTPTTSATTTSSKLTSSSVNPESSSSMDPENVGSIFSFSPNILTPFMELQSVPLYESDPWNHKSYDLHYPLYVGGGSYEAYLNSKRLKRNSRGYTNNILTPSILDHFLKVRVQFEKSFPELYKSLRDQQRALNLTRVFVKPPVIPKTVMYPPTELGAAELLPSDLSSIQNIDPTTKSEDVTDYFLFDDDD